jgi:hypothetical protein
MMFLFPPGSSRRYGLERTPEIPAKRCGEHPLPYGRGCVGCGEHPLPYSRGSVGREHPLPYGRGSVRRGSVGYTLVRCGSVTSGSVGRVSCGGA